MRLPLSKGPSIVGVSHPPCPRMEPPCFQTAVFSSALQNMGQWTKFINPVILSTDEIFCRQRMSASVIYRLQESLWWSEKYCTILSCVCMTVDRVWIPNCIWHFNTQLVSSVTVFTALLGNIFRQWTFLCVWAHILTGLWPSHTNLLLF
jgi:hypothetical protein